MGALQAMTTTLTTARLGACGEVPLSALILQEAHALARRDYRACEAERFSVEEVRDIALPAWLRPVEQVLPIAELGKLGLSPCAGHHAHLYATCGVDPHVDDMDGLSVGVVLHSDGFTFKQGRTPLLLSNGRWFVFDDRLEHEVVAEDSATTLLIVAAPLQVRQVPRT